MIPKFPEFKIVEINDREAVEAYTHRYSPYSDFNFTNLWAWDTKDTRDERMISELNGNLVVRFTDCDTGVFFFSFLGTNDPVDTIAKLLRYAEESGVSSVLRLVPEESITGVQDPSFLIEEDRNNFDYLYSTEELALLKGNAFKRKRQSVSRFLRTYPDAQAFVGTLDSERKNMAAILNVWYDHRGVGLYNEQRAISRLCDSDRTHELLITVIRTGGSVVAFSIDAILPNAFALCYFAKADVNYIGVTEFLNERIAEYLMNQHVKTWNWEQDLGIEGLHRSKMSYRPQSFLKKFTISKRDHLSVP